MNDELDKSNSNLDLIRDRISSANSSINIQASPVNESTAAITEIAANIQNLEKMTKEKKRLYGNHS